MYAVLIGAGFIYVMGGSVIRDAVEAFALFMEGVREAERPASAVELGTFFEAIRAPRSGSVFEEFGIGVAGALAVFLVAGLVAGFRTRRGAKRAPGEPSSSERTVTYLSRFLTTFSMVAVQAVALSSLGSAFLMMGSLGWVRLSAILLVLTSLISCVFLNPARLLKTAGVVIALVVTSVIWDVGVFIVRAIEAAPKA